MPRMLTDRRGPARTDLPVFRLILAVLLFVTISPAVRAVDADWPREIKLADGGKIIVYQPQPESLDGNILTGRAAVAVTMAGTKDPVFGAGWFRARLDIDRDTRIATVVDVQVTKSRFPNSTPEQEQQFARIIETEVPRWATSVSLDDLTAGLAAAESAQKTAEGFDNDPPKIIVSREAAVLVLFDGEPLFREIEDSGLQRAVNSAYLVVQDGGVYYLSGGNLWYSARSPKGPWQPNATPPAAVLDLVPKDAEDESLGDPTTSAAPPRIIVATVPTELIAMEGDAAFAPIGDSGLLYVTNTDRDLFMETESQRYFVLLAGRWFASRSLDGPWAYVRPDQLPGAFAEIPADSDKANVLASVPGTPEAEDAIADAAIPQTAAIQRSEAKLDVQYDGEPQFEKIPGTEIETANNTGVSVLLIRDRYYACSDGVWYVAGDATGPWAVADETPPDLDQIPPSSPVYNVRYVTVYESTPEIVYVGYTPGYLGCYPYYGTIVYGTGWYYRPYIGPVYYYRRPCTWGFNVTYNPWTGWGYGMGFSTGFINVGFLSGGYHTHYHGGCCWGGGWYGPAYHRPPFVHHGNVRIGERYRYGNRYEYADRDGIRMRSNLYGRPEYPNRAAVVGRSKDVRVRPTVAKGRENNVYSDRDGNVYRRSKDGAWQRNDGKKWSTGTAGGTKETKPSRPTRDVTPSTPSNPSPPSTPGTRPTAPTRDVRPSRPTTNGQAPSELQRDAQARDRSAKRAKEYEQMRKSSPSKPTQPSKSKPAPAPAPAPAPRSEGNKSRR